MTSVEYIKRSPEARTAVVSMRLLKQQGSSRVTMYALEDLLGVMEAADIVAPAVSLAEPWWLRRVRRAIERPMKPGQSVIPSGRGHLDRNYELLFVSCESVGDLLELGPPQRWTRCAKRSVVYVEDYWAGNIPNTPGEIALLKHFDLILVSYHQTVGPLGQATNRETAYLPPTVDVLSLCCPLGSSYLPERTIDFYAMGRRSEKVHRAMRDLADDRGLMYLYDTLRGGNCRDPHEHRRLFGEILRRTKYFMCYPARFNEHVGKAGPDEIGSRYFEGAAAGTVLLGQPPNSPVFRDYFPQPDAVVELAQDGSGLAELYDQLEADPDRVNRIRTENLRQALLHHDWAYQWRQVLKRAGLEPLPELTSRCETLRQVAGEMCGDTANVMKIR